MIGRPQRSTLFPGATFLLSIINDYCLRTTGGVAVTVGYRPDHGVGADREQRGRLARDCDRAAVVLNHWRAQSDISRASQTGGRNDGRQRSARDGWRLRGLYQ